VLPAVTARVDVFVVDLLGGTEADRLLYELRESGLAADRSYGSRSVKKQWSAADRSGASWGVMLAPDEHARGHVAVKDLRSGEQVDVRRDEVAAWLRTRKEIPAP
jgi:histidyl-tRNA synthetase